MKQHWFYILLSVSSSARYGTAIHDDVRELSNGQIRLWPATLYGSLEELTECGWLEEVGADKRLSDIAGRERFYQLTRPGREALEAEVARMEWLAGAARARLEGGGA